jgi:hypothetical protein
MLPIMVGIVALVAEAGQALIEKTENQRAADISAYAAALAYASGNSTPVMNAAAQSIAALNGISAEMVSANLTTSPRNSSRQAVSVSISSSENLLLAPVMGSVSTLSIAAGAAAELEAQPASCISSLASNGAGLQLANSGSLSAQNCTVASNATISVGCGSTLNAQAVTYDSLASPMQPCGGLTASVIGNAATADPLVSNSVIGSATSRVVTVASITSPSPPTPTAGGAIDFGTDPVSTGSQAQADGCAATLAGTTWTLTCPQGPSSTYNFGAITVASGMTVNFNTAGLGTTTYNFSGSITNSGTALNFGPGTYNTAQGIMTAASTTTSFGAGTFNVGPGTGTCNGGATYSICNRGASLTFDGPSNFTLSAGIYNASGSILTLGNGSANSFQIGASSDGNSIYAAGGATTTLADATSGTGLFQLAGNIEIAAGGGCVALSAAAQHDVNGSILLAGGTLLGAGVYTATGFIAIGENGAGDVTCNGVTLGVNAAGVTMVSGASTTPAASPCYNAAFCVASGYTNVTLTAPTSGGDALLLAIGPTASTNGAGASFASGASNTSLSGVMYFPNGAVTLSGAANVGNGAGQCLQVVGSQITVSGTTAMASTCLAAGTGAPMTVALVQ